MKIFMHFITITRHKWIVLKYCFRIGLYRQGIAHDLSKYSPTEFFVGAKYYQGDKSPNVMERKENGYSAAWLHHKGRNPHHFEYWTDYTANPTDGALPLEMPVKYIAEMLVDRIAACKIYNGKAYTDSDPLNYFRRSRDVSHMHPKTKHQLECLLLMLAEKGEASTLDYIKRAFLKDAAVTDDYCGQHQNN